MNVDNSFSKLSGLYKVGPGAARRKSKNTKELEESRRDKRRDSFNVNRNIEDDSNDATENILPDPLITQAELRKQRLLNWKTDKEEALKMSKSNIKKPFVVGIYRHSGSANAGVGSTRKAELMRETRADTKIETKPESPKFEFSSNVKPSMVYKFHGSSSKKLTVPMSPIFMKREAARKLQLKNYLEHNPTLDIIEEIQPVNNDNSVERLEEKLSNDSESECHPDYSVRPFVTLGRRKQSARRSNILKPSPRQRISLRDESTPDEPADGPTFQKARLNSETSRLLLLADEWEKYARLGNINQDTVDDIDLVVGQTRLLTRDKFKQFRTLIEQHEADLEKVKVTLDDLNGFWEMMYLQVENLNKKYERLEMLKSNNWVEPEIAVKQKPAKGRPKKSVVAAKSSVRDFIKASKINSEQTCLLKKVLTPIAKKRRLSARRDSPAAYNALRLSFTAKDFGTPPLILVEPLLEVTKLEEKLAQKVDELKQVREKLDLQLRSSEEYEHRLQTALEEKAVVEEQLQAEVELCAETEEKRIRLAARKQELEEILHDLEARIKEEEERYNLLSTEKKKLQLNIQDLKEQLEEEKGARQKLQLEKVQYYAKFKKLEEDCALANDTNQKLTIGNKDLKEQLEEEKGARQKLQLEKVQYYAKFKKLEEDCALANDTNQKLTIGNKDLKEQLEEEKGARQKLQLEKVQYYAKFKKLEEDCALANDTNQKLTIGNKALAEEEEKAKHLGKLISKQEATIAELEERLLKDHQQRQEMDRTKRKVKTEGASSSSAQSPTTNPEDSKGVQSSVPANTSRTTQVGCHRKNKPADTTSPTHNGDKPYVCTVCDYKCSRPSVLKIHMRIHSGDKPYSCNVCPFKCSNSSSLTRHKRIHTGDKPYSCNFCSFKSSDCSSVKRHIKNHHTQHL